MTDSARSSSFWPRPWHSVQGLSMTRPPPPQAGQARAMEKKPWLTRISPAPPQVVQTFGLVPGLAPEPLQVAQSSRRGMTTSLEPPNAASSKVISRW